MSQSAIKIAFGAASWEPRHPVASSLPLAASPLFAAVIATGGAWNSTIWTILDNDCEG
jgi:hypothetical protein